MTALFDRMIDAVGEANAREEIPARWRLNHAAMMALRMDRRFYQDDCRLPFDKRPLFGTPISVIDDGEPTPTFYLHTDSRDKSRNEDPAPSQ